jgi:CheY-like chemotaxis protein
VAAANSLRGRRVLVVDDIDVNRRIVLEQLSAWGMRNGSHATGEEALTALRSAHAAGDAYDFVIADHEMPGIDGATLAATIKSDPALRDTVFILLTPATAWKQLKGLEGGSVDVCLVKPARRTKLMNTLSAAWIKKVSCRIDGAVDDPSNTTHSLRALGQNLERADGASGVHALVVEDNTVK